MALSKKLYYSMNLQQALAANMVAVRYLLRWSDDYFHVFHFYLYSGRNLTLFFLIFEVQRRAAQTFIVLMYAFKNLVCKHNAANFESSVIALYKILSCCVCSVLIDCIHKQFLTNYNIQSRTALLSFSVL